MERLKRTIDLCVELALPGQAVPTMNTGAAGKAQDLPAKEQLLLDRLGMLTEHASERGVVVCIEPHVGGAIHSLARAEWLVQAIDSPHLRLDFDVSHFEVQGVPTDESVRRLAPLAGAIEIKDQRTRPARETADGWVEGNGFGDSIGPDGQGLRFQFLLGGEGDFDLSGFLRLIGEFDSIAFEASVQCQARPGYDALAAAERTFDWMVDGWRAAGITFHNP
jgi:sugar phosphate isomerase/epimerase